MAQEELAILVACLVVLTVTQDSVAATNSRLSSLLRAVRESKGKDVTMSLKVVPAEVGKVGEILCAEVEKINPAMLILGSSSKSQVTGFLVGSVSQYAVRKASIPVIVARIIPTL
ncbi:hypothetical protein BDK51DRAFT_27631 [Blyttiomyces helicus]|uniref:UspA domain-containing protein n=1 Tax=Blyttiomyces helicus TaxID=388810 RepID=A0A4P9W8R1_9FUNG|nr:hypothetical protein BDK51DRAFT_27631 [Blyttiomyces helicus]|eukprot:RKO88919.1 hypothetical protein BDK51DRAFT_27631 [Blyttiomyces helicus]